MDKLEDDYPGDMAWRKFSDMYARTYLNDESKLLADKLCGNIDIAVVIYGKRGLEQGLKWIEKKIPALDNVRPIDCISDAVLIKRLKAGLMRMP